MATTNSSSRRESNNATHAALPSLRPSCVSPAALPLLPLQQRTNRRVSAPADAAIVQLAPGFTRAAAWAGLRVGAPVEDAQRE